VGKVTAFSPQEATKALYELKSAGLTTNQAMEALKPTLDLVALSAGKIALGEGATAVAVGLKKFQKEGLKAVDLVNMFAKSTQVSNFHIEELLGFLDSLGSAPATYNMLAKEALAFGAVLRNVGQSNRVAGHSIEGLTRSLVSIQYTWDKVNKMGMKRKAAIFRAGLFDKLGTDIFTAEGKLKSISSIAAGFTKGLRNMKTEQEKVTAAQLLFGAQGKNVLVAVEQAQFELNGRVLKGEEAFLAMMGAIEDHGMVAKKGAEEMLKTWWGVKKLFQGTKETIQIVLGETLLPLLKRVVGAMYWLANELLSAITKHKMLAKAIGMGVAALTFFLLIGGATLTMVSMLVMSLGMMTIGLQSMGVSAVGAAGSLKALRAAAMGMLKILAPFTLIAIKVILIAAAIAAASYIIYSAYRKNLGGLADFIDGITTKIGLVWRGLAGLIGDGAVTEELADKLKAAGLWDFVVWVYQLSARLGALWEGFREGLGTVFDTQTVFGDLISSIVNLFGAIGELLGFGGDLDKMGQDSYNTFAILGFVIGGIAKVLLLPIVGMMYVLGFWLRVVAGIIEGADFIISKLSIIGRALKVLGALSLIALSPLIIVLLLAAAPLIAIGYLIYRLYDYLIDLAGGWDGLWDSIVSGADWTGGALDMIWEGLGMGVVYLKEKIKAAFDWAEIMIMVGESIVGALWDGIKSAWGEFKDKFGDLLGELREMLPFSDAHIGPLSALTASGMSIPVTLSQGVAKGMPTLDKSMNTGLQSVASTIGSAVVGMPSPVMSGVTAKVRGGFGNVERPDESLNGAAVMPSGLKGGSGGAVKKAINITIEQFNVTMTDGGEVDLDRVANELMEKIGDKMRDEEEREN